MLRRKSKKKLFFTYDIIVNYFDIAQEPEVRIPVTQGIVGHVATTGMHVKPFFVNFVLWDLSLTRPQVLC